MCEFEFWLKPNEEHFLKFKVRDLAFPFNYDTKVKYKLYHRDPRLDPNYDPRKGSPKKTQDNPMVNQYARQDPQNND